VGDYARRHYERLGGRYATDLTDAALAQIEPFLPPSRPSGRSRTTILRLVLNAIRYVPRRDCPLRACWPCLLSGDRIDGQEAIDWRLLPTNVPLRSIVASLRWVIERVFAQLGRDWPRTSSG
jgi:transposase